MTNRIRKIINDPVYGFITIDDPLVFQMIAHPWYQRLRRIHQMAFAHLVYPGAVHTRLHHSLGAYHLMYNALTELKSKGVEITPEEETAAKIAILLHDIGHGPFSHALENVLITDTHHETISILIMRVLNEQMKGQLHKAIDIFTNNYTKPFLHQLISGQFDVDRMDYLTRDSFYTGVSEGVISADRIIKMLNVVNNQLAIEAKGIYSIEKFIIARRLMYWQVYLHKTVLCAENLLVNILKRAKELAQKNEELFCTPPLKVFLYHQYSEQDFTNDPSLLENFALLDDHDIMTSVKVWVTHPDKVLSTLCDRLLNRKLLKVELQNQVFKESKIEEIKADVKKRYKLNDKEVGYLVFTGNVVNEAYKADKIHINILFKDGTIADIAKASDQLNTDVLAKTVRKHYLCYPKNG